MLLSIIIPMYNVSHYLKLCINNIKIDDIEYEIIMIDDGSPDDSFNIANELKNINQNIKVLSQSNKGLGGARNLGIDNAKGKYILFLDADDILVKSEFEFLKNENSDILEFSSKNINKTNKILSTFLANDSKVVNGIKYLKNNPTMFSACNKLYKKAFLDINDLRFREKIYIEDFEFNTRTFFYAKNVKSYSKVIQNFVQVDNSITRNNSKDRKLKLVDDMVKVVFYINNFKNSLKLDKDQRMFFEQRLTWLTVDIIYHTYKNKLEFEYLERNINILKNNNIFYLSSKLPHSNKDLFRKFLKLPMSLLLIKLIMK